MPEAITVPSVMMMTSIVSEESLARDTHTYGHARRHTHTHTHTHTDTHTDRLRSSDVKICNNKNDTYCLLPHHTIRGAVSTRETQHSVRDFFTGCARPALKCSLVPQKAGNGKNSE